MFRLRHFLIGFIAVSSMVLPAWGSNYFPPISSGDTVWETVSPVSLGWKQPQLDSVISYVGAHNSTGFIMLYQGRIMVERYWRGWTIDSAAVIASAAKSITAFLAGIAQEQGKMQISDTVSRIIGQGWSKATSQQELQITVRHVLTMTGGLNDSAAYVAPAGSLWYYNTPIYYRMFTILKQATGQTMNQFTKKNLWDRIGMNRSLWLQNSMAASTRDMARFGLMIITGGIWNKDTLMHDRVYFQNMLATSQNLNHSYGYLWWLNGKNGWVLPGPIPPPSGQGELIPAAPSDMVVALGKGDKKIYVVPSMELVIVRHGDATGVAQQALSSFDNELWIRIMAASPGPTTVNRTRPSNGLQQPKKLNHNSFDALGRKVVKTKNLIRNLKIDRLLILD